MKRIKISIPEPCHEKWSEMTPIDIGRFCSSCQKCVIDFTTMSNTQIAGYLKNGNNLCGRFMKTQLQEEYLLKEQKKGLGKLLKFATSLATLIALNNKTNAQE